MRIIENGMKMGIVRSDIRVISLSEGEFFGEGTYLDRVMTPGIIEVVDVEEGLFTYEGTLYRLDMSKDGNRFDSLPQTMENCFG